MFYNESHYYDGVWLPRIRNVSILGNNSYNDPTKFKKINFITSYVFT